MRFSGAELTIRLLEQAGITTIAGIPGGAILPLYDALFSSSIRHILARHEQGAGFIAQGMARASGKPAVCFATSGPGATNLLTALADAKLDSIPIIAITAQVPTRLMGTDAFQEVDTYGMCIPITKHAIAIRSARQLLEAIPQAFRIATQGRPGPVLIDIPKDILMESIELDQWPQLSFLPTPCDIKPDSTTLEQIAQLINKAQRPLLYSGGGIISSNAHTQLQQLAELATIPCAMTLMGLGALPATHPLALGMLGMHGARSTNQLLDEADLVLAFGVRFDDRATGSLNHFCSNATIVHIDIDPAELNKLKPAHYTLQADIRLALEQLLPLIEQKNRHHWLARVNHIRASHALPRIHANAHHPQGIMQWLSCNLEQDAIIATDVGQHQMWTAQFYPVMQPRTLLTSGGLGTMGFGLPTALGAALAFPNRSVICISGDGSILMNLQELSTLAELQARVKIILLNNNQLGLVRQQQEFFYESRFVASTFKVTPDFYAIARGFGIAALELEETPEAVQQLKELLDAPGPAFINVPIHQQHNVVPMVPPGAANHQMIGG